MKRRRFTNLNATRWQQVIFTPFLISFIVLGGMVQAQQSSLDPENVKAVESCIHAFADAADARDLKALEQVLHPNYRSVLNKAFGSDEVTILSKEDYISMAKAGKIGGAERTVQILSLDLQPEVARATVLLQSESMRFTSFFSMVRNAKGNWQMIEDLPRIEKL